MNSSLLHRCTAQAFPSCIKAQQMFSFSPAIHQPSVMYGHFREIVSEGDGEDKKDLMCIASRFATVN